MSRSQAAATLPPSGLAGLDPAWSRLATTLDGSGVERTWHVLDTHTSGSGKDAQLTLLCVHGNPSWAYLFRDLLARARDGLRIVAVDHLDMGFSERTGTTRRLGTRIDDLGRLTDALGVVGPVVTVAHDWGGPISLGWAQRHRPQLRGIVLMNTAVHQPAGSPAPTLIRIARSRPVLHPVTTATTMFLRGAFELSEHRPSAEVRAGFLAPYRTAQRRVAIADFVADIPLEPDHPSATVLDEVAAGLGELGDVPALLVWGAADRVFSDLYLHDLEQRLPHADVHRYPTAGHFVTEDTDALDTVLDWVGTLGLDDDNDDDDDDVDHDGDDDDQPATVATTLLDGLAGASRHTLAVAEMNGATIDFDELRSLVDATAAGLAAFGVRPGQRIALMIPPGIDLAVALLACWRVAAVAVLIDAGLGRSGMSGAIAAADPDHLIGIPKAMAASRALRWPGRRISTTAMGTVQRRILGVDADLPTLRSRPGELPMPATVGDVAAIAFTSGATGPSKGVLYDHGALAAQRDAIASLYDITTDDRLVAAFAPFALFGPLLGITSVVPAMDVTAPSTLTAAALGDAVTRVDATLIFASPAALRNVVETADSATPQHHAAWARVRLVLSAGAPVGSPLLHDVSRLFPNAKVCTPYGMTECLPVANISLAEIDAATGGDGVCVGMPIDGVNVMIRPLDASGAATGEFTADPNVLGEVVVRAAHARVGYDRLWHTQYVADRPTGWHSTGDIGSLDDRGRLWIGGRLGHVITTAAGPVAPVRLEQAVERVSGANRSAVVGVGPVGTQQIAVVVEVPGLRSPRLADVASIDSVRSVVSGTVAVLEVPSLPVDRRHHSKIDRGTVARWASRVLATGDVTRL